jgi:hypothetical protein
MRRLSAISQASAPSSSVQYGTFAARLGTVGLCAAACKWSEQSYFKSREAYCVDRRGGAMQERFVTGHDSNRLRKKGESDANRARKHTPGAKAHIKFCGLYGIRRGGKPCPVTKLLARSFSAASQSRAQLQSCFYPCSCSAKAPYKENNPNAIALCKGLAFSALPRLCLRIFAEISARFSPRWRCRCVLSRLLLFC